MPGRDELPGTGPGTNCGKRDRGWFSTAKLGDQQISLKEHVERLMGRRALGTPCGIEPYRPQCKTRQDKTRQNTTTTQQQHNSTTIQRHNNNTTTQQHHITNHNTNHTKTTPHHAPTQHYTPRPPLPTPHHTSHQRAEYWEVILALQAYSGIHIGIDNLNVLRGVAALLSHRVPRSPLPLVKDGDLLATIHSMLSLRGFDTVQVSKVKGHATHAMVASGAVRLEDLVGNNGADAADLGRLRQQDEVITARRDLLRVRRLWYPIVLDLHRFMVASSRIEVNHDGFGGTAPDAMVWDKGGIVKPRAPSFRLIVDHATLPGPPEFVSSTWCTLNSLPITQDDVAVWPSSVDILLVFSCVFFLFGLSSLATGYSRFG